MGVEGQDKAKALEAGATALSGQLGRTVQRLRKAYNLSLSELSEQAGVKAPGNAKRTMRFPANTSWLVTALHSNGLEPPSASLRTRV